MSDSDEDQEEGGGRGGRVSMAGFLFGNIDLKTGQLEDDLLDSESKRQLNALQKFGLGSIMQDVMEGQEQNEGRAPKTKRRRLVASYDSSSDSEEEEEEDEGDKDEKISSGNLPSEKSAQEEESFDEQKSPSAVDFSDISELAAEEETSAVATLTSGSVMSSGDDDDDYDSVSTNETDKVKPQTKDDKFLMPPPSTTHIKKAATLGDASSKDPSGLKSPPLSGRLSPSALTDPDKKLETPLAAMMPSKYEGVNVSEIFPEFRRGKVLRWSRLFAPGKPSSLPQIWKNVKRRRRKRKQIETGQPVGDTLEDVIREKRGWDFQYNDDVDSSMMVADDEEEFLSDCVEKPKTDVPKANTSEGWSSAASNPNIWRHGPAELWYDMLNVSEDGENFDYGIQVQNGSANDGSDAEESSSEEEDNSDKENTSGSGPIKGFAGDAFHMITQRDWESDIIWDGGDAKYKKLTKNTAAGWVPSGINRTAQNFGSPGSKGQPATPTPPLPATIPVATKKEGKEGGIAGATMNTPTPTPSKPGPKGSAAKEEPAEDNTWYSIFPVETPELVYGRWEDEIIWNVEELKAPLEPKILELDPNDENIVLCMPDDVDPNAAQGTVAPVKVKIPHPHVKKSKILLGKAGVINVIEEDSPPPSPKNDDKDPYNISNDEYYLPKFSEQSLLKISASGNIIQHSTPVVELRAPFIPTYISQTKLRAFHRPSVKKYSNGPLSYSIPHQVFSLTKHIQRKAKQREQERLAAGGGDIFFMRAPDDLSGKDGELILIEYCEEHPPLMSQVGMCSRIRNYYKRLAGKDKGPPEMNYGEVVFAHTTPFLGIMQSGSCVQTIENLLYRSPIYQHPTIKTDFLVIRTRQNYFIRAIDALFTAGQECPLFEVPGPNSKRANNFVRDFLQVFIYRLFWKSRDSPRRIRMEEIKRAFPMHSESSIRKRLKLCADFKRTGTDSNWWVIKPEFRLPTEEEIRSMVSPEQCCAYFSLIAAEQRLKDAGYGEKFLFAPQEDDDDENQSKIDDEVKCAPWNTTRAYIQAMRNKCLLQLTGPADPTGCGEGFSYIRVPNKPQTNKEEQEAQPKRIVTGTDADLRRLSLNNAKALLRKFDVPEEEIKKLSRWEVIDVVRTLSTEKAKAGEKGMTKFSRGNRFSVAEHQERYKEECQRIFELQNKVLANSEVLSTDDESSDSELSDIEEMGKNIENIISNKKTNTQVNLEKEEQERLELQKMILGESKEEEMPRKETKSKRKDEEETQTLSGLVNHPGRVLRIHRTYRGSDGKEYTRTETVRKAAIIDIYMRIRTTKDEPFIRQFALLDEQAKEEMKKEKRRIQEQLRRIKRNQEKDHTVKPVPVPRKKKVKLKPDLKMKCGACGQVGHMKTNKACPLYSGTLSMFPPPSSGSVTNAPPEEDEEPVVEQKSIPTPLSIPIPEEEELVRVEGTKVQLSSSKIIKYSEEAKRQSLIMKVPKGAVHSPSGRGKKRKTAVSPHCDYLSKKRRTTNRRRIDPQIVISGVFEDILNELRDMPNSSHFHQPVNLKIFSDYTTRVPNPMDLRTIRERIRQRKYQLTSDFLKDVEQIHENSVIYNSTKNIITEYASNLVNLCKQRLMEKAPHLEKLEKLINPLLDTDQIGLSYILDQCLIKLKGSMVSFPFSKPVDRKKVPNYYNIIKTPMDLSMMEERNKEHMYESRQEFMADFELIVANAKTFNGPESVFVQKAQGLIDMASEFLNTFTEELIQFEANIEKSKSNIYEEFADVGEQSQDSDDDDDMEVVEPMAEDEQSVNMSYAELEESMQQETVDMATTNLELSQEREEGEYVSDEDGEGVGFQEVECPAVGDVDESLLFSRSQDKPFGAETPRNIHEDLEVSESEDESEHETETPPSAPQPQPPQPPDDDGLWF